MSDPTIRVLPDPAAVAAAAADLFVEAANEVVDAHEVFTVALAGGSTPKAMYELLAAEPFKSQVPWERVEVYFGDERCVPSDYGDSNYKLAHDILLSKVPIPASKVFRMKGETDPEQAATEYGQMLKARFGDGGLDLILLGMGQDGHTASLFPGTAAVNETKHRVVANWAENSTTGKSWRITLTAPFINRARQVAIAVTGQNKAKRVEEVLLGEKDPQRLPVQLIDPAQGKLIWLLDAAAAGVHEQDEG